jgi:resuscitation-promoting factor RpfB
MVGSVLGLSGVLHVLVAGGGAQASPGSQSRPPVHGSLLVLPEAARDDVAPTTALPGLTSSAGPHSVGVWMAEGLAPRMLGILRVPAASSTSAVAPDGLSLPGSVAVTVVVKGKTHDVLTNAATVRQLLSAMGIRPDWNDRVSPSIQAPILRAPVVRYVDVALDTVTVTAALPFQTYTTYSSKIPVGKSQVLQPGRTGTVVRTYRVRVEDGKEVSRRLLSQRVTGQPVAERRVVGVPPVPAGAAQQRVGEASWYDHAGLTAASPWLPFGTRVTVTNLANGRSVTVVINDRGPFGGRIIDLSQEAFSRIAPLGAGVCQVRLAW